MTQEENIYLQVLLENKKITVLEAIETEKKCKENVIKNPSLYHEPAKEIIDSNKWIKRWNEELSMINKIEKELKNKIDKQRR